MRFAVRVPSETEPRQSNHQNLAEKAFLMFDGQRVGYLCS